jgi:hypothetical protein
VYLEIRYAFGGSLYLVSSLGFKNGYYRKAGLYFICDDLIIFYFSNSNLLRWKSVFPRLGRMGHTIKLIEDATRHSLLNELIPTVELNK